MTLVDRIQNAAQVHAASLRLRGQDGTAVLAEIGDFGLRINNDPVEPSSVRFQLGQQIALLPRTWWDRLIRRAPRATLSCGVELRTASSERLVAQTWIESLEDTRALPTLEIVGNPVEYQAFETFLSSLSSLGATMLKPAERIDRAPRMLSHESAANDPNPALIKRSERAEAAVEALTAELNTLREQLQNPPAHDNREDEARIRTLQEQRTALEKKLETERRARKKIEGERNKAKTKFNEIRKQLQSMGRPVSKSGSSMPTVHEFNRMHAGKRSVPKNRRVCCPQCKADENREVEMQGGELWTGNLQTYFCPRCGYSAYLRGHG